MKCVAISFVFVAPAVVSSFFLFIAGPVVWVVRVTFLAPGGEATGNNIGLLTWHISPVGLSDACSGSPAVLHQRAVLCYTNCSRTVASSSNDLDLAFFQLPPETRALPSLLSEQYIF